MDKDTMEGKENIATPLKTRSSNELFDWKMQCFICGEKCDPRRDKYNTKSSKGYSRSWSCVESSISADGGSTYSKVLCAAQKRQDQKVIDRLLRVPNGDLVAVEARYRRKKGCLSKYYETNQKTPEKCLSDKYTPIYKQTAEKLKNEYEREIIFEKKVYYLSTLRKRFIEIVNEDGSTDAESYKSSYLKKLLSDIWPDVSFVPQQKGKTDLVCSSSKTLGDAMKEAKNLEQILEQHNECQYDIDTDEETDEAIVHKAVGILRKRISEGKTKIENEYFSPDELSVRAQKDFIDPLLYKAVCWLHDGKSFNDATEHMDKKCLTLACDLTSLVTDIPSPKHLGLAVHLYNDFGSKHLVEDMHCMGYSISYSELRMFLSSAANKTIDSQKVTPSGGLVPETITPREQGGKLSRGRR